LRDFIDTFHNLFLDPPIEVILLFKEFDLLKSLLVTPQESR